MRTSILRCGALSVSVAAALLAGCGGSPPPIGAPGVTPQNSIAPARVRVHPISSGWSYRILLKFHGRLGHHSRAPLVNVNGVLYGTTTDGGKFQRGTVFSIRPSGAHSVLHQFSGGTDGAAPWAGLIEVNGTLYGTTTYGGSSNKGTVFSLTTAGVETVLYSFTGGSDGGYPYASLTDVNGTLYGTTEYGGNLSCGGGSYSGCGTVYSINTSSEHVLHSFINGSDGAFPAAGLLNVNGTLYGTTLLGGAKNCYFGGCGTVYSISTAGKEKVVYRFKGGNDGVQPLGGLIDVKDRLYGTTSTGGSPGCGNSDVGCGIVYSVSTTGQEKVLFRFPAGANNGGHPDGDLLAAHGIFYGTTSQGGQACGTSACGPGTIYSITTAGEETVLYTFSLTGGEPPTAGLTDVKGALYGTTLYGGEHCPHVQIGGCGTVFALSQ
jgi:uncharacterized repeat protein (TIGR03803 family)